MSFIKGLKEWWDSLRGKGPAAAVALTLDLSEARDNKSFNLEAGGLIVETCTGDLYVRINGPNGDGFNLRYTHKILYPFSSLYLTNEAQAGKSARILLLPAGMDVDPPYVLKTGDVMTGPLEIQDRAVVRVDPTKLAWYSVRDSTGFLLNMLAVNEALKLCGIGLTGYTFRLIGSLLDFQSCPTSRLCLPTSAPPTPTAGAVYFDQATNRLWIWNETTWSWVSVLLS